MIREIVFKGRQSEILGVNAMSNKISSNSVSLAGEFAVLSQLALRGYDANMTLGNTKSVDILVSDPKTNELYQLEVKTALVSRETDSRSRLFGLIAAQWIMRAKHETILRPNLWYCFVRIQSQTKVTRFFVVPSKIVAEYVRAQHQLWMAEEGMNHRDNDMRNFRLGRRGESYLISTPTIEDYEDNWEFVG